MLFKVETRVGEEGEGRSSVGRQEVFSLGLGIVFYGILFSNLNPQRRK